MNTAKSTAMDAWIPWDWKNGPMLSLGWRGPERTVAIADGMHASASTSDRVLQREAANASRVVTVERGMVSVVVEAPDVLATWMADPCKRFAPAIRAERQADLERELPTLRKVPAKHRALLLSRREAMDLHDAFCASPGVGPRKRFVAGCCELRADALDPVIVAGPIGQGAWPMHPAWVRRIQDDCHDAGVAFAFARWGDWAPRDVRFDDGEMVRLGEHGRDTRDLTNCTEDMGEKRYMQRLGADRAGRLIEGEEHLDLPEGLR